MHSQGFRTHIFIFCLCVSLKLSSQITITPTLGCAPLAVMFSGPAGATNPSWILGPGMSSSLSTASHIYTSPGTYQITYTALVNGSPVSHTGKVIVTPGPSANFNFTVPQSHCAPMTVQFSAGGGSPGSTYLWSFGDLTPLVTGSAVTHVYAMQGSFKPAMVITDAATGCTAVASSAGTINVSNSPFVVINASALTTCSPPLVTSFTGSNSGNGSPLPGPFLSASWQMTGGNPGSALGMNTGPVTFGAGTHTVTLTLTDNNKCSGSTSLVVSAKVPSLAIITTPTICTCDTLNFKVFSTEPVISCTHTGAPPTTSLFAASPSTWTAFDSISTLCTPGLTHFTVSIQPFGCAPLTTVVPVFVEQVIANFTSTPPSSSCDKSTIVNYINLSTTNTSHSISSVWVMDGGGGYNSGVPTPQFSTNSTFTITQGSLNPYTIYKPWTPKVTLEVTSSSAAQCKAGFTFEGFDTIQRVTSWFWKDKQEGCAPLNVNFYDSSFTMQSFPLLDPVFPITGYTFFTGVGTNSVSGTAGIFPLPITYSATGTYTPWMIVETQFGCLDTSYVHTITVVNPPQISMTNTPNLSVCAGQSVQVTLTSTDAVNHWHVVSDNGFYSHCINNSSPSFPFTHTGVHGFTVMGAQSGCSNTVVTTQTITVKGPFAKFRYKTSCDTNLRKNVDFTCHLQEVQTATLSFGDSSPPVVFSGNASGHATQLLNHAYPGTGNYVAALTVENGLSGCAPRTYTQSVTVRELRAVIRSQNGLPIAVPPQAHVCKNLPTAFTGTNSQAHLVSCKIGYKWSMTGPGYNPPTEQGYLPLYHTDSLKLPGIYTVQLVVSDVNGCTDTARTALRVGDVAVAFDVSPNPVCIGNTVQITSTSTLNPADGIDTLRWYMGDQSIHTTTSTSFTYTYSNASAPFSILTLSLLAESNIGCLGIATRTLQVNNPFPSLQPSNAYPCIPLNGVTSVFFTAVSGYATYSMSFNDPPSQPPKWVTLNNFNNVVHGYAVRGVYVPTVIVTDNAGCVGIDSTRIIAIGQPTANILFADGTQKYCYPATPSIVAQAFLNGTPMTNHLWTVNGITTAAPGNTVLPYIFTSTGVTNLVLRVDSANYCPSTATAQVFIFDPLANFALDKSKFCLGETINVSIVDSSFVESWRWFMGDFVPQQEIHHQSVLAVLTRTLSYPYNIFPSDSLGKTTITLRYTGPYQTCIRTAQRDIQVINPQPAFKHAREEYRHCLEVPDDFLNLTRNPANHNFSYTWEFGDGTSGEGNHPNHLYSSPGVYSVVLAVTEAEYGCEVKTAKNMTVLPLPQARLSIFPVKVCPDMPFDLIGEGTPGESGQVTGTLTPSPATFSFSPENTFTVNAIARETMIYSLTVTDNNQCVSKPDTAFLKIPDLAPAVHWDTTVIIGQTIPINAYAGTPFFSYSWTPVITDLSCDTCFNPVSTTTLDITYTVQVVDEPLRCFSTANTYRIIIRPEVTLDVPTAFTPDGDGINDIIYPGGWGLRKLNYFRIFNRWGQLIFDSNNLNHGWDGRYQGVPQNMETYVYQVSVDTFTDETLVKTGSFKLLR